MASTAVLDGVPKVYACPTCARVFNKKANLKVHSRKHTGEKPYACSRPGCGRRFMWKSSVSFHEQNCQADSPGQAAKRDLIDPSTPAAVPKRPKVVSTSPTTPSSESPPRTRVTDLDHPRVMSVVASQDDGHHSIAQQPHLLPPQFPQQQHPLTALQRGHIDSLNHVPQNGAIYGLQPQAAHQTLQQTQKRRHASMASHPAIPCAPDMKESMPTGIAQATSQPLQQEQPYLSSVQVLHASQKPFISSQPAQPYSATSSSQQQPSVLPVGSAGMAQVSKQPPVPPSFPSESAPLPAPATILSEKRMPTAGGRPPVIPSTLPKHYFVPKGVSGTVDAPVSGPKAVFDLKVPSSGTTSNGKLPGMFSKMPKMPIAMELEDSDDEGADRIVGAQDTFMRTGNPFGGFAPPTRCSPLPASSPIVCPGLSPMPLSPLAPFSPLPPDSPAHNAPNPVHPPINQGTRPNTNF